MATKAELLKQFEQFDKSTLEKLLNYGTLILIPETDLLTEVTQYQLVQKAHALADQLFPEWTDRSASDFGQFLVELFALFSEKDFWYLNAFSSESLLHKMAVYSNAYWRARELGYQPDSFTSATTKIRLTFEPGPEVLIAVGDIVLAREGTEIKVSNTKPLLVQQSAAVVNHVLDFAHGVYTTKTKDFNGKSFRLTETNIDASSMSLVDGGGIEWLKTNSFAETEATDKVYLVIPEENATADIVFGNNVFGYRPPAGLSMTATYRRGGGTIGNQEEIGTYTLQETVSGRTISSQVELLPLSGGVDQESLPSIQANAPLYFRTKGTVINPAACTDLLNRRPDVYQAFSYVWTKFVYFYVIPADGTTATTAFLEELRVFVNSVLIMGFESSPMQTTYVDLATTSYTAFALNGFVLAEKEVEIRELLMEYTDPLRLAKYGTPYNFAKVVSHVVSNVEGLTNMIVDTVQGLPAASFVGGEVPVPRGYITKALDSSGAATVNTTPTSIEVSQGDITITVQFQS